MGIDINLAAVLAQISKRHHLAGDLLTLGEQAIGFDAPALAELAGRSVRPGDAPLRQRDVFEALGFSNSESADIHSKEGADHLLDLNDGETPAPLCKRFDVVLNGGTLEHVYHVPNALAHITRMLRSDGVAIHVTPCNNWVDHGFYQISPTLLFDYGRAAGFTPLESMIAVRVDDGHWEMHALMEGEAGGLRERLMLGPTLHIFAARLGADRAPTATPLQRIYDPNAGAPAPTPWFPPYRLHHGRQVLRRVLARRDLSAADLTPTDLGWSAHIPEFANLSDNMEHPRRSTLALYEDGAAIGPPHCAHADVRTWGGGRYSHWNDGILFSTRDGSAPATNGRHYEVVLFADWDEPS